MSCSPASRVYQAKELVFLILEQADWSTLMAMSKVCKTARLCSNIEARRRVTIPLLRFFTKSEIQSLFSVLRNTRAIVVGSVAASVPRYGSPQFEPRNPTSPIPVDIPEDLNIVVPFGQDRAFKEAMVPLGFTTWRSSPVRRNYVPYVTDVLEAFKYRHRHVPISLSACLQKIFTNHAIQDPVRVTVSIAAVSVMGVVLASPTSAQMSFFTHNRYYSMYPCRATSRIAWSRFNADIYETGHRRFHAAIQISPSNKAMTIACGPACPAMRRKTYQDHGVGIFYFDGDRRGRNELVFTPGYTDPLLNEDCIVWRLHLRCRNVLCPMWDPDFGVA